MRMNRWCVGSVVGRTGAIGRTAAMQLAPAGDHVGEVHLEGIEAPLHARAA